MTSANVSLTKALRPLLRTRAFGRGEVAGHGLQEALVLVLGMKRGQVGGNAQRHRPQGRKRLQAVDQPPLAQITEELLEELVRHQVRNAASRLEAVPIVARRRHSAAGRLRLREQLRQLVDQRVLGHVRAGRPGRDPASQKPQAVLESQPCGALTVDHAAEQLVDQVPPGQRAAQQPRFIEVVGNVVEAVGQPQAGSRRASHLVPVGSQVVEKLGDRFGRRSLRVGAGDVDAAVIVAAAGERLLPGAGAQRFQAVPLGHVGNHAGRELAEDQRDQFARPRVAGAVDPFEAIEHHQQLLHVLNRQLIVDAKQRVGHRVDDVLAEHVVAKVVNVLADFLDRAELFLADPADQAVDFAAILGKVGRDLGRQEGAGQMGDLQRAVDAVVVRNRDELHPPLPRPAVDFQRLDEAFGRTDPPQNPLAGPIGMLAVDVQIDAGRPLARAIRRVFATRIRLEFARPIRLGCTPGCAASPALALVRRTVRQVVSHHSAPRSSAEGSDPSLRPNAPGRTKHKRPGQVSWNWSTPSVANSTACVASPLCVCEYTVCLASARCVVRPRRCVRLPNHCGNSSPP